MPHWGRAIFIHRGDSRIMRFWCEIPISHLGVAGFLSCRRAEDPRRSAIACLSVVGWVVCPIFSLDVPAGVDVGGRTRNQKMGRDDPSYVRFRITRYAEPYHAAFRLYRSTSRCSASSTL